MVDQGLTLCWTFTQGTGWLQRDLAHWLICLPLDLLLEFVLEGRAIR